MGGECSTHGRDEQFLQILVGNINEEAIRKT